MDHWKPTGTDLPERAVIVSEWTDGDGTGRPDLSNEIAGQKMVLCGSGEGAVIYWPETAPVVHPTNIPGFLFMGDDGDSLWFWPESEPVAFRFEQEAGDRLRRRLTAKVDSLVSQGAFVFCYQAQAAVGNEPEFWFPELTARAA